MEWLTDPQAWISLGVLTALEIVLGVDNIVFISILAGKLPAHQQAKARRIGLLLALLMRVGLLLSLAWVMLVFADRISEFVDRHPTVKMLALSFLLLIGVSLLAEGFGQHLPKGYIYFSMAFSVFVELLNHGLRRRRAKQPPVPLHKPYTATDKSGTPPAAAGGGV